jgi:hypothetical protein
MIARLGARSWRPCTRLRPALALSRSLSSSALAGSSWRSCAAASALGTRLRPALSRSLSSSAPAAARLPSAAELLATSAELTKALEAPPLAQQLAAARGGGDTLVKWVTCNMVLTQQIVTLAQGMPQLGEGNEGIALLLDLLHAGPAASEAAGADASTLDTLHRHGRERWGVLLRHGFGCELGPEVDLAGARALAIGVVDAFQSHSFLRKVSELMRGELMAQLSDLEKQQAVTRLMIIKQKEAAVLFGYASSDEGYAQSQAALQVFVTDAVIQGALMQATQRVLVTAGIDMQRVMQDVQKQQQAQQR